MSDPVAPCADANTPLKLLLEEETQEKVNRDLFRNRSATVTTSSSSLLRTRTLPSLITKVSTQVTSVATCVSPHSFIETILLTSDSRKVVTRSSDGEESILPDLTVSCSDSSSTASHAEDDENNTLYDVSLRNAQQQESEEAKNGDDEQNSEAVLEQAQNAPTETSFPSWFKFRFLSHKRKEVNTLKVPSDTDGAEDLKVANETDLSWKETEPSSIDELVPTNATISVTPSIPSSPPTNARIPVTPVISSSSGSSDFWTIRQLNPVSSALCASIDTILQTSKYKEEGDVDNSQVLTSGTWSHPCCPCPSIENTSRIISYQRSQSQSFRIHLLELQRAVDAASVEKRDLLDSKIPKHLQKYGSTSKLTGQSLRDLVMSPRPPREIEEDTSYRRLQRSSSDKSSRNSFHEIEARAELSPEDTILSIPTPDPSGVSSSSPSVPVSSRTCLCIAAACMFDTVASTPTLASRLAPNGSILSIIMFPVSNRLLFSHDDDRGSDRSMHQGPGRLLGVCGAMRTSVLAVLVAYAVLLILFGPIILIVGFIPYGEYGAYTFFFIGLRAMGQMVARMIAFPGASQRHVCEVQKEFSKYMVGRLDSFSATLASFAVSLSPTVAPSSATDFNGIFLRAEKVERTMCDVLLPVLEHLLITDLELTEGGVGSSSCPLGSAGDVGFLEGVAPEAIKDAQAFLSLLRRAVADLSTLLPVAREINYDPFGYDNARRSVLFGPRGQVVGEVAKSLYVTCMEMREKLMSFVPSEREGERKTQFGQILEAARSFLGSSVPLHSSVFCLDLLRACVLNRFPKSKQIWVERRFGVCGRIKIDVMHIPCAEQEGKEEKAAALYCQPNAGLYELATGMNLLSGKVEGECQCWSDFYLANGYDVYLFNYAGYGRSGPIRRGGNGPLSCLRRIFGLFFTNFKPSPSSLKADALAVANYITKFADASSLLLHGESIGGLAAAHTARVLCDKERRQRSSSSSISFLVCDRTFCNLPAVGQRLVGAWAGPALQIFTPLWKTNVVADYLATTCNKIVACDASDAMIVDPSSLKAGVALSGEVGAWGRGVGKTSGVGLVWDAPVNMRVADWGGTGLKDHKSCYSSTRKPKPPQWPKDRHVLTEEAFYFAFCVRRIGKWATLHSKNMNNEDSSDEEEGIEITPIKQPTQSNSEENPFLCSPRNSFESTSVHLQVQGLAAMWSTLARTDSLTSSTLGVASKLGFDAIVAWLCASLVFGGQQLVRSAEERCGSSQNGTEDQHFSILSSDFEPIVVEDKGIAEFGALKPLSIPSVIQNLKKVCSELEIESRNDLILQIEEEIEYVVAMLTYVVDRISSERISSDARDIIHDRKEILNSVGTFLNLKCGHNSFYSENEQEMLKQILLNSQKRETIDYLNEMT
mmetsp:Transcript_17470/g.39432  ORF Transcript_17470/g.39432 Transcript_17470/m.39432 type:complete len:1386 (-) Transcript_17470:291-4448(-)